MLLQQTLLPTVVGKRRRGRPFRAIRDNFVDSTKSVVPTLDERGRAKDWIGHARVVTDW